MYILPTLGRWILPSLLGLPFPRFHLSLRGCLAHLPPPWSPSMPRSPLSPLAPPSPSSPFFSSVGLLASDSPLALFSLVTLLTHWTPGSRETNATCLTRGPLWSWKSVWPHRSHTRHEEKEHDSQYQESRLKQIHRFRLNFIRSTLDWGNLNKWKGHWSPSRG